MLRKNSDWLRDNDAAERSWDQRYSKRGLELHLVEALTNMDLPFPDAFICHEKIQESVSYTIPSTDYSISDLSFTKPSWDLFMMPELRPSLRAHVDVVKTSSRTFVLGWINVGFSEALIEKCQRAMQGIVYRGGDRKEWAWDVRVSRGWLFVEKLAIASSKADTPVLSCLRANRRSRA